VALGPIFGVLFDGLAYGMLLFLLSVGPGSRGDDELRQPGALCFCHAGGYTGCHADERPDIVPARAHGVPRGSGASVAFERTLYRLYRATELDQVPLTIGLTFMPGGGGLRPAPAAAHSDAFVSARLDDLHGRHFRPYRLFSSASAFDHSLLALTLEYAVRCPVRRRRQPEAHGARPRHQRRCVAFAPFASSGLAGLAVRSPLRSSA
jgi:branched-chain amino acid transport system permease protein